MSQMDWNYRRFRDATEKLEECLRVLRDGPVNTNDMSIEEHKAMLQLPDLCYTYSAVADGREG